MNGRTGEKLVITKVSFRLSRPALPRRDHLHTRSFLEYQALVLSTWRPGGLTAWRPGGLAAWRPGGPWTARRPLDGPAALGRPGPWTARPLDGPEAGEAGRAGPRWGRVPGSLHSPL